MKLQTLTKNFGLKDFLKKYWKEIIFSITFFIFNILFLNYEVALNGVGTGRKFIFLFFFTFILEFFFIFLIYWSRKKSFPIEKKFLCYFIPIGLFMLVAIPIGKVPDELRHLTRAYGIANGHLVSSETNEVGKYGEYLDIDSDLLNIESVNYKFYSFNSLYDNEETTFGIDTNVALYSFTNYVPQSFGFLVGKILNSPTIFSAYLGRFFNFIIFSLLIYFSLKLIPFGKKFIFLIAFLPITIQEAISLSADALAIATSIFLISFIFYLSYDKKNKNISGKDYFILIFFMLIQSLCKIVYLPLCFLIFLIPKEKFKSVKNKFIRLGFPLIAIILVNLVWLFYSSSHYLIEYNPGVNSSEQLSFLLTNLPLYVQIIFNTVFVRFDFWLYSMMGGSLELLSVNLGWIYPICSLIALILIIYSYRNYSLKINFVSKIWAGCIMVGIFLLILTSLYLQWTAVGEYVIDGVQGRYFIPFLAIIPFFFFNTHKNKKSVTKLEQSNYYFDKFVLAQSLATIILIMCTHL